MCIVLSRIVSKSLRTCSLLGRDVEIIVKRDPSVLPEGRVRLVARS